MIYLHRSHEGECVWVLTRFSATKYLQLLSHMILQPSSTRFSNRSTLSALPQRNPSACSPPAAPRGRCYQWGWESPAWWQREHWEKPTGLWLSRMLKTMALKGVFAGHQIPRPTYPWRPGPTFLARNLSTFSWGFKSKGFQDWAQSTYNQSFFLFKCLQTVTPVPKALLQEK